MREDGGDVLGHVLEAVAAVEVVGAAEVGGQAGVAIVRGDHVESGRHELADEVGGPADQLRPAALDED